MRRAPERPAPPAAASSDVVIRWSLIVVLVLAPLLFGAFFPWVFGPLHVVAYAAGLFVLARGQRARRDREASPALPAQKPILAFGALILLQLVPLPPPVLRLVSPGTFDFHTSQMLVPLSAWKPVSVSPADTFFGLVYFVGMALLYLAVFRLFQGERAARPLLRAVVYVGMVMTFVALVQKASGVQKPYGLLEVEDGWAVLGPYLSPSHFAGYLVMAIPLGLGFTAESLQELQRLWARRRVGWLALGEPAGSAFVRRGAEAMVLVVGLVAAASRGAFVGFVFSVVVFAALTRRRLLLVGIALVAVLGVSWIGLDAILQGFASRGVEGSRLALWRDALRMFPDFPLLGLGFNAFGMAYRHYQTFWIVYFIQAAHNEYLDLLLTMGLVGVAIGLWACVRLAPPLFARARRSPVDAGVLAAVLGLACHNLVDFNWQIQANAATFVALLALAVRPPLDPPRTAPLESA
ncbi:MAG TPA: O-antigen ligase family protein [Vicinamibacteria bacterium]